MVTVRKSKLLSTSSAIQPNTYYYEFDVDTVDELPDPYYNGTIVAHGSKATIINSGEIYRINGDGEWKSQSTNGGASLPEVTSEDNGDVLTVVDGAWDKATPENNVAIFEATSTSVSTPINATLSNSKTHGDIIDAIDTGKFVVINITLTNNSSYDKITLTFNNKIHANVFYKFTSPFLDMNTEPAFIYTIIRGDTPTETNFNLSLLNLQKIT